MLPSRVLRRVAQVASLTALCVAGAPPPAAAQSADPPAGAARAVVLIALPAVEPEAQAQLREALLAQFALLPADPRIENDPEEAAGTSLGQRMSNAQARGAELGAVAVFWIDPQPDGRWMLHMMDSESERILVRAVDARAERRQAAIEAVAVMVRESTRALIEGGPAEEAMSRPKPIAAPELRAARAETDTGPASARGADTEPGTEKGTAGLPASAGERPVRLWLGYHADEFADGFGLQHGAAGGGGWLGLAPFYIGLSIALTYPIKVDTPQMTFEVQRFPIGLVGGYRYRLGIAVFDFELGPLLDIVGSGEVVAKTGFLLEKPEATTTVMYGLTGRVRAEVFAVPTLSVFANLGADIFFNDLEYVTMEFDVDSNAVAVRLSPFRPVAEVGLAFYP